MIVLWGVLRDVFPDSGRVPGQHWHQKFECNLHVYLRLFMDTLTASPQDSLAPKPNFVDIFTASSPRYSAATYFLPSGVLCAWCVVKHGAASRPWSWLICAVRVRCCFIPTVWGYSLVINKYIYINMIQLWLLCWVVSILWQCALRVRCCFIPRLWCCSYVIQLSLLCEVVSILLRYAACWSAKLHCLMYQHSHSAGFRHSYSATMTHGNYGCGVVSGILVVNGIYIYK